MGVLAYADRHLRLADGCGGVQGRGPALEVLVSRVVDVASEVLLAVEGADEVDAVHAVSIGEERRRPEEQSIGNAEHCRVGADAEGQRDHDRRCEAGLPAQAADRVANVLPEGVEHWLAGRRNVCWTHTPWKSLSGRESQSGIGNGK